MQRELSRKAARTFITDNTILILLACIGTLIHTLLNGQYSFPRDELDIILNTRPLNWERMVVNNSGEYLAHTPYVGGILGSAYVKNSDEG